MPLLTKKTTKSRRRKEAGALAGPRLSRPGRRPPPPFRAAHGRVSRPLPPSAGNRCPPGRARHLRGRTGDGPLPCGEKTQGRVWRKKRRTATFPFEASRRRARCRRASKASSAESLAPFAPMSPAGDLRLPGVEVGAARARRLAGWRRARRSIEGARFRQQEVSRVLNRSQQPARSFDRRSKGRHRRTRYGPADGHVRSIPLTEGGVPAATPGSPAPSPVVVVSGESRSRFPWLPSRVIAGSIWRGPQQERVKVDENGEARPWRSPSLAR
jgi:hypothetical protein